MLSSPIKKETDVLPRSSVYPKRRTGISNIQPRSRFVKARPNIHLGANKTYRDTQLPESESKGATAKENNTPFSKIESTTTNVGGQDSESPSASDKVTTCPIKKEPELLPRPSVLPKRTPRARFQRARPNIGALASKASKEVNTPEERSSPSAHTNEAAASKSASEVSVSAAEEERPQAAPGSSSSMVEVVATSTFNEIPTAVQHTDIQEISDHSCESQETSVTGSRTTAGVIGSDNLSAKRDGVASKCDEMEFFEANTDQQDQSKNLSTTEKRCKKASESATDCSPMPPLPNKSLEYPTLKSILNSPRKRTTTKKTHERKKRLANLSANPTRSELTMIDLIYYNPTGEPMKTSKPLTTAVENLLPVDENTKPCHPPVEEEPEDEDSSSIPVPKLIIGENGEIIIDESSLVVRRKETIDTSIEAIVENDNTTYSSFRKRSAKQWTTKETSKFYKALSLVGTDFALMESIFTVEGKLTRTRRELKLKFKREEKLRIELVHRAMYDSQTYDISILDDEVDDLVTVPDVDDPETVVIAGGKKRGRKPKVTGEGSGNKPACKRKKKNKVCENGSVADENVVHSTEEESDPEFSFLEEVRTKDVDFPTTEMGTEVRDRKDESPKVEAERRPQRLRKTKVLSDFITDVDDLEDSNEARSEPVLKKRNVPLSPDDYSDLSENVKNSDETFQSNKLLKVNRKKKPQLLPTRPLDPVENKHPLPDSGTEISRAGRVRKAKVLPDFIIEEDALDEAYDSEDESVLMTKKRRKVQILSEDSEEEFLDAIDPLSDSGTEVRKAKVPPDCITEEDALDKACEEYYNYAEENDGITDTSEIEVFIKTPNEYRESPKLVMGQIEACEDVAHLSINTCAEGGSHNSVDIQTQYISLVPSSAPNSEDCNKRTFDNVCVIPTSEICEVPYNTYNNNTQYINLVQSPAKHKVTKENCLNEELSSSTVFSKDNEVDNPLQSSTLNKCNSHNFIDTDSSKTQYIKNVQSSVKSNKDHLEKNSLLHNLSSTAVICSQDSAIDNLLQFSTLDKHNSDSVENLLTDAVISEVVTTDKVTTRRVRRRAAPNVARASQRPRVTEFVKPKILPSFTNFTPAEEQFSLQTKLRTYSRKSNESTQQVERPSNSSQVTSPNNRTTTLDLETSFQEDQTNSDPPPVMIFTKSPNNENILHLFMVKSPTPTS